MASRAFGAVGGGESVGEPAVPTMLEREVVEEDVVVGRGGRGQPELAARLGRVRRLRRHPAHVVEVTDQVLREVVLRHVGVVFALEW